MIAASTTGVVIVNWNAGDLLRQCVESLLKQSRPPARVVVVDNGSTDDSLKRLGQLPPHVEVVRLDANLGFAAANNFAVERLPAEIEWIALLNPDAVADPRWLESLQVTARDNPEYDFFACRAGQRDRPEILDGAGDVYHFSGLVWRDGHGRPAAGRYLHNREVFSPCAAAALYRRSAWVEAGGMDERFFCYIEDVDLGFRLRLLGYRCLYSADAVVEHVGSHSTGRNSDFSVYHGHRNLVWCFFKNLPAPLLGLCLIPHLLMTLATVTLYCLRGQGKVILKAKADAIAGLRRVLGDRRGVQSSRRLRTLDMLWTFSFALFRR